MIKIKNKHYQISTLCLNKIKNNVMYDYTLCMVSFIFWLWCFFLILYDPCLLTSYSDLHTTSREFINLCQFMRYVNL